MPRGGSSIALSPERSGRLADRLAWAAVLCGALSVLALALALSPDPTGTGTHTQLGLPPCALLAWAGLPCPACGLTTSFAHIAHLQWSDALRSNAAGVPLFAAVLSAALLSPLALWRGWSIDHVMRRLRIERVAVALGVLLGAVWLLRMGAILLA